LNPRTWVLKASTHTPRPPSVAHTSSCNMGSRGNRLKHEADHSPRLLRRLRISGAMSVLR
jgi:hypothetical protein